MPLNMNILLINHFELFQSHLTSLLDLTHRRNLVTLKVVQNLRDDNASIILYYHDLSHVKLLRDDLIYYFSRSKEKHLILKFIAYNLSFSFRSGVQN